MRALTSTPPQQSQRSRPITPAPAEPIHPTSAFTLTMSAPATPVPATSEAAIPMTIAPALDAGPPRSATTSTPEHAEGADALPLLQTVSITRDLVAENSALKLENAALRDEMRVILDHSIESDQRLIQFTEEVFLPPGSSSVPFHSGAPGCVPSTVDCAVQCDPSTECVPECCFAANELVCSLRTTISVLEAEVQLLRAGALRSRFEDHEEVSGLCDIIETPIDVSDIQDEEGFTVVTKRRKRNGRKHPNTVNKLHSLGKQKPTQEQGPSDASSIPFKNITVLGDSHVRGLAAIMRNKVGEDIFVGGVCKPGAGLLSMLSTTEPPRDHCYVLMAGTNDVDVGNEDVICNRLEEVLNSFGNTSHVLLVPLTARHDLPHDNPIHWTIRLVNTYMAELRHRHKYVELLDISCIGRRHFTRHGLHLRGVGKRLLANSIVRGLSGISGARRHLGARGVGTAGVLVPTPTQTAQVTYAAAAAGSQLEGQLKSGQVGEGCPASKVFLEKINTTYQVK